METEADMTHTVTQAKNRITGKTTARTTEYVRHAGIGGVVEDLELLIRRYPVQALLLGFGCGYLLSRARSD